MIDVISKPSCKSPVIQTVLDQVLLTVLLDTTEDIIYGTLILSP